MAWTKAQSGKRFIRYTGEAQSSKTATSSATMMIGNFTQVDVQVLHADHADTSTWAVVVSNDGGTTWSTAGSDTTTGASGDTFVSINGAPGALMKILVTETDGDADATLTPHLVMKSAGS